METVPITTLDTERFDKHVTTLTPSQKLFAHLLRDWIDRPRNALVLVSGGPGTGKTYTVTRTLECVNLPQLRMAYAARIAQKILGRTIHSTLKLDWTEGSALKTLERQLENETDLPKCIRASSVLMNEFRCDEEASIIVVDEIGMVPYWLAYWIVRYFFDRSTKPILFVAMGDSHQLRPVRSNNNLFGLDGLEFETHRLVLTESKRFEADYEPVVARLREFVDAIDDTGLFAFLCSKFPVVEEIDANLLRRCTRALAFRNATVDAYNRFYVQKMVSSGKIVRLYRWDFVRNVADKRSWVDVKPGCRVFVTENNCSSVTNGTPLTFDRYSSERDVIDCTYPGTCERISVKRNKFGSFPIALGFAGTVHKFQGETINDKAIVINFDGSRDLNLVYTALSRVRSMQQILAIAL